MRLGVKVTIVSAMTLTGVLCNHLAAEAASLSFGLGGANNGNGALSIDYSVGGVDLTVTAFRQPAGQSVNVVRRGSGLGARRNGSDDIEIDGDERDETLRLSFDQLVRIVSAEFSRVGTNDRYRLFVDGDRLVGNRSIPGGNGLDNATGFVDFTTFRSARRRTGQIFDFTVPNDQSDYFLRSVVVEQVPTPALLPGAVGFGVAFLRRKKRQQPAQ